MLKLAGRGGFGETVPGEFNPFIPPAFRLAGPAVAMADDEEQACAQDPEEQPDAADNRYYYFRTCPLCDDCSVQSFAKAKCWGWTEDEAKEQLAAHLIKSGLHELDAEPAWAIVEAATLEVGDGSKWKKGRRDAHALAKVQAAPPAKGLKRPGSSTELAVGIRGSGNGGVFVSKEKLQMVIDSLARASTSAKHSQKLAAAAAEAFGAEATVLAETKATFEAMKSLF